MKAVPAWLTYTILRLLMIAVPLAILLLLHIPWVVSAIAAVLIGLCLSYIFLRGPRDEVSKGLYEARRKQKEERRRERSGETAEDADAELLREKRRDILPDDD